MAPPPNILKIGNKYFPDMTFMFSNKVKDPTYAGRNPYSQSYTQTTANNTRTFTPDRSVLIKDPYRGYRPNGYNMFNRFDPGTPNTTLDYSLTPPTLDQLENSGDIVRMPLQDRIPVLPYQPQNNTIKYKKTHTILGSTDPNNTNYLPYIPRSERRAENNKAKQDRKYLKQAKEEANQYNSNVRRNGILSMLRRYPLFDSVQQYIDKKKNTPDYSGIENARDYALRPTNVLRQSANHITGNLKFNPYDTTAQANSINAQTANGIDAISRRGRGNLTETVNHINNLLANNAVKSGDAYLNGWKANEAQRMNVAQANMKADEFNAQADNAAEQNYISARNSAAMQDKANGIKALDEYAKQKYLIDTNYENTLRGLRDQMASNIGEEGRTAYENNRTNTSKEFNYWYDDLGRMHHIAQQGGAKYVEPPKTDPYYIADGDFAKVLEKYKDNNAVRDELYNMMLTNDYAKGRSEWYNKYKQA